VGIQWEIGNGQKSFGYFYDGWGDHRVGTLLVTGGTWLTIAGIHISC
jgi:hypothetical protein